MKKARTRFWRLKPPKWIAACNDNSRHLNQDGCRCLYQVLLTEFGDRPEVIPDWNASWDSWFMHTGDPVSDVAGSAVDQMSRGGLPTACHG